MARSSFSLILALAVVAAVFGLSVSQLSAQPTPTPAPPVAPAAPAAAGQQNQYPEVNDALKELSAGRVDQAYKLLGDAARKYPELPSPNVFMYLLLAQLRQPNAARQELEKAVVNTPSDPEPWVILGNIAVQEGRIAEAESDFDKCKQLLAKYTNPKRKGAIEQQTLSGIALVAELRKNWADAQARLDELLVKAPEDVVVMQRLARALFWQTKVTEAYDMLKKAKKIDLENSKKNKTPEQVLTPEAIMAGLYDAYEGKKAKETKHPEQWYMNALQQAPKDLPTRRVVCLWALENGKVDLAKEQADGALQIEQSDPKGKYAGSFVGRMLRGLVALWQKDWAAAETNFQSIVLEDPANFAARNNLALALVEQDDTAKKQRALAYAEENYRNNKDNVEALSTLGWVYFRRAQFEQAGLALDQAIRAMGGNLLASPDTATYVAHMLYHGDRKFDAKSLLENVFKLERPFSMKKEADELYEKCKDAKKPEAATPPATTTPAATTPK